MGWIDDGLPRRVLLKSGVAGAVASLGSSRVAALEAAEPYADERGGTVVLGNERLELAFETDTGGLAQLTDKRTGLRLRNSTSPHTSWWVTFHDPDGDHVSAASYRAAFDGAETATDGDRASVTLRWRRPRVEAPDATRQYDATVRLTVSVERGDPQSYWRMDVTNDGDLAVEQLQCPFVTHLAPPVDDGADALVVPNHVGRRFPNPTRPAIGVEAGYPGSTTMQFTAYTSPSGGFYADARDPDGYTKSHHWEQMPGVDGELLFYAAHHVPRRPAADASLPYPVTLGGLTGDWHDAVDRYRRWVDESGWLPAEPPDLPDWLLDLGGTHMMRSYEREGFGNHHSAKDYDTSTDIAIAYQDWLRAPIQMLWTGWTTHGYPSAGDWFPPREGETAFDRALSKLADADVEFVGWINSVLALERSDWWRRHTDRAKGAAIRTRDGGFHTITDSGFTFNEMEFTHPDWRSVLDAEIGRMIAHGATEIDMDGFPFNWTPNCFADDHDHPPGRGGAWFSTRAKDVLERIRSSHSPDRGRLALSGEGVCDFYLPHLDVFNTRDAMAELDSPAVERGWAKVVPMFQYAYGDRAVTRAMNSTALVPLFDGRAFVWGAIPAFGLWEDPGTVSRTKREELLFLQSVARGRATYANRFVARGTMLRQPVCDVRTVPNPKGGKAPVESVLTSAWRAPSGEVAIAMAKITDQPETLRIDLADRPFDLPEGDWLAFEVVNGTYRRRSVDAATEVTVEFSVDYGVGTLVFAPDTPERRDALAAIEHAQSPTTTNEERLVDAKRAFEDGRFEEARRLASQVGGTTTESTADESTTTASPVTSTEPPADETTASTPGFGVVQALGGAALAAWRIVASSSDDE